MAATTVLTTALRQGVDTSSALAVSGTPLTYTATPLLSPTDIANPLILLGVTIEFSFDANSPKTWAVQTSVAMQCGTLDRSGNIVQPFARISLEPGSPIPTFVQSKLTTPQLTSVGLTLEAV